MSKQNKLSSGDRVKIFIAVGAILALIQYQFNFKWVREINTNFFESYTKYLVLVFIVIAIISMANALLRKNHSRKKQLSKNIYVVDRMSGKDFEIFLKAHFENLGYKVELTGDSHDYGADLIARKVGESIAIQAKRHKSRVGISAVQQVISSMQYYKCEKGIVVSNSYYTKPAKNQAEASNVELWDRSDLSVLIDKQSSTKSMPEKTSCPECGAAMQIRMGKFGEFIGCSNFPKCTYSTTK